MIGLDTNILVRYLTQDDPAHAQKAQHVMEAEAAHGQMFLVTSVVMCEVVWVLESAYQYERADIAMSLDRILRIAQFEFEDKDLLWQALDDYRRGKAGFADYVIGRSGQRLGCSHTLTFDTGLKANRLFRVL